MIDYKHLSDRELKSRVEQFGTENEREILARFLPRDCDECPTRERLEASINDTEVAVRDAITILEECVE